MTHLRRRKTLAVLAVGLVLFAAFIPAMGARLPPATLTLLWVVEPTVTAVLLRRDQSRSDEQPTSLLSLIASRAPPSVVAFA
jgi:hypothetical protein